MPSKKIRSRKKKGDVRTKSDVYKSLWKIGQEIGDIEPLMKKYVGHDNAFHNGSMTKEFIDTETEPIDKALMDKIKLYIDEVHLWREKTEHQKANIIFKTITMKQFQLVYVYANMSLIYDRQQAIQKIFEGWTCPDIL